MGAPDPESYRLSRDRKTGLGRQRQTPMAWLPCIGTQTMWMASSRHSVMQCSSLPQTSGRGSTAIDPAISRHLTPQTSTHRLQPVHLLASTTGIHFSFTGEVILCCSCACYFTMMEPFIQGCGAHWKWTTPFWSNCLVVKVAPGVSMGEA